MGIMILKRIFSLHLNLAWLRDRNAKIFAEELMLSNCGAGEDSWESLGLQEDQTSQS